MPFALTLDHESTATSSGTAPWRLVASDSGKKAWQIFDVGTTLTFNGAAAVGGPTLLVIPFYWFAQLT